MNAPLQVLISAAASFIVVTFIFGVIFLLCKRNRRSGLHPRQTRLRNPPTTTGSCYHPKTSSTVSALDESASFDPSLDRISMAELVAATRNFSADGIIGDGSFGFVYKAVLRGGATVAVKKLSPEAFQGLREFSAEMETLGRIRHPNLVRMLAFCAAGEERVLIYEFVQHGSLDQWLYPDITSSSSSSNNYMKSQPLDWPRRKKIMTGVASGLCYLHEGCEPRIIHRDIKASNVLLDEDFGAHIADFGLARRMDGSHSHVSTQVAGTMGYMPPEYRDGLTVATVKADVYSFGILMFEVATGKRPNWPVKMDGGKEVGLIVWARRMVEEERHVDMIDPLVLAWCQKEKEMVGLDEVREFLKIAYMCTSESPKVRPTMGEVVVMMSYLEHGHDVNTSSQPSICVV